MLAAALTTLHAKTARGSEGERPAERDAPTSPVGANDPLRLAVVGGVGVPHPLSLEGMLVIDERVAVGLEYGVAPKVTVAGVDATLQAIAGDLRLLPFGNAFFFGTTVGRQHFAAASTVRAPKARPASSASTCCRP